MVGVVEERWKGLTNGSQVELNTKVLPHPRFPSDVCRRKVSLQSRSRWLR